MITGAEVALLYVKDRTLSNFETIIVIVTLRIWVPIWYHFAFQRSLLVALSLYVCPKPNFWSWAPSKLKKQAVNGCGEDLPTLHVSELYLFYSITLDSMVFSIVQ